MSKVAMPCRCEACLGPDIRLAGRAHNQVRKAVQDGKLLRLTGDTPCCDCGKPATEYDHRDYTKPLDVAPVCRSCNKRRGRAPLVMQMHLVSQVPRDEVDMTKNHLRYKLRTLRCKRCKHEWLPRKARVTTCPNIHCRSPFWNEERVTP